MQLDATRLDEELESALVAGTRSLPAGFVSRQRAWIESRMLGAGGFPGRTGGADPYYAAFALRTAGLLGVEPEAFWTRAAAWVAATGVSIGDTVGCHALLSARAAIARYGHGLDPLPDAGVAGAARAYLLAVSAHGPAALRPGEEPGLHATFLAMLSWAMLGEPMGRGAEVVAFVRSLERPDGGFSDRGAPGSSVSQTAAAVSILAAAGPVDAATVRSAGAFVESLQREGGGLAAHPGLDGPDLLSSFVGLVAALRLECAGRLRLGDLARFAKGLARPDGGFLASPVDTDADAEFTYYGVSTLALLASMALSRDGTRSAAA